MIESLIMIASQAAEDFAMYSAGIAIMGLIAVAGYAIIKGV